MAYKTWTERDVSFVLIDDLTGDGVLTIRVTTPLGEMSIMGEPREEGRTLIVGRVHVSSSNGVRPNSVGLRNLRLITSVIRKVMDYDDIRLEGEVRTTGANPGRRPRPIRFA